MKFIKTFLIILMSISAGFFLYQTYEQSIQDIFFADDTVYNISIGALSVSATLADSDVERVRGLSGVSKLSKNSGKLFIFDNQQRHGIWMKDMNFPIDVMWFDNNLELVFFEERLDPSSYPAVFTPNSATRFVVEMNANFIHESNIHRGDKLTLPPYLLPEDIRKNFLNLQE